MADEQEVKKIKSKAGNRRFGNKIDEIGGQKKSK